MKTLRWGLVGASRIAAQYMIEAIRASGDTVAAVMSSDAWRAKNFANQHGIAQATNDLAEMLATPDLDAVYISTTNDLHYKQLLAAVRAGKHVLCEKPLAITLEDAQDMVAECSKHKLVMATNHHLRNGAAQRKMRAQIAEGRIGKPLFARVFHAVFLPPELHGWRLHNKVGGGVVFDITVHDADTLRFVLGDEPVAVSAMLSQSGLGTVGVEDGAMGIIRFKSGLVAQFHDAYTTRYALTGLEVHGEEGSLIASDCMTQTPHRGMLALRSVSGEENIPLQHDASLYVRTIQAFGMAIAGKGSPVATGDDGVRSLGVAIAAQKAGRTGRETTIDLQI